MRARKHTPARAAFGIVGRLSRLLLPFPGVPLRATRSAPFRSKDSVRLPSRSGRSGKATSLRAERRKMNRVPNSVVSFLVALIITFTGGVLQNISSGCPQNW